MTCAVFTVSNLNYLPKVLVLADSLKKYQGIKLKVFIFDIKRDVDLSNENVEIHWIEDEGCGDVKSLAFKYDVIEFTTSLKPFLTKKLLDKYEFVIFLDPDTEIFSDLNKIFDDLKHALVLLTPHHITPQPSSEFESDLPMMRFGSFNLGFFAVKQNHQVYEFLDWWDNRCRNFCFMESQFGLSTDQKWITIAPCFFDFIKISRNPGYNVAPWNTFERSIEKKGGELYVNGESKLVFFHFSNFDHSDPQYLKKRASTELCNNYPILEMIGKSYSLKLKSKEKFVSHTNYSYDHMSDGSYITPTLRRAYSCIQKELPPGTNPFDSDGPVGIFARDNLLLVGKVRPYSYPGLRHLSVNTHKISFVYLVLKLVLRFLGPARFYDLTKLLVYVSILRFHRALWKFDGNKLNNSKYKK